MEKISALPAVLLAPGNVEIWIVAAMCAHVDIELYILSIWFVNFLFLGHFPV